MTSKFISLGFKLSVDYKSLFEYSSYVLSWGSQILASQPAEQGERERPVRPHEICVDQDRLKGTSSRGGYALDMHKMCERYKSTDSRSLS